MEEEKEFNIDEFKKEIENDKNANNLITLKYLQKEIKNNYKKELPDLNPENLKENSIMEIINILIFKTSNLKDTNHILQIKLEKKKKRINNLEKKNSELTLNCANLETKLKDTKINIKKKNSVYENQIKKLSKQIKKLQFDFSQKESKLKSFKDNIIKKNYSKKDKRIIILGNLKKDNNRTPKISIKKKDPIKSQTSQYIIKQRKIINTLIFSNRSIFERLRNFCLKRKQFIIKKSEEIQTDKIDQFNNFKILEEKYNEIESDKIEIEDIIKTNLALNSSLDFLKEFEAFLNKDFRAFIFDLKTRSSLYKRINLKKNVFSDVREVNDLQNLLEGYWNLAGKQKEITVEYRNLVLNNRDADKKFRITEKNVERINFIKNEIKELERYVGNQKCKRERSVKRIF